MNKLGITLFVVLVLGMSSQTMAMQSNTPEGVIRGFYSWYIKVFQTNEFPLTSQPAKMKKYISTRFYNEAKRAYDKGEYDADYFISGQDADPKWATNMTISKVTKTASTASAIVFFDGTGSFDHKLRITLVKEKGLWKIDRVKDLMN